MTVPPAPETEPSALDRVDPHQPAYGYTGRDALDRVRAEHTGPHQCRGGWYTDDPGYLGTTATRGPCRTLRAIEGEPCDHDASYPDGHGTITCTRCGVVLNDGGES